MYSIGVILSIGVGFAIAFIWPIHSLSLLNKKRINSVRFIADIVIGSAMAALFFGTASGMMIATIATVLFTAYLEWSARKYGSAKYLRKGLQIQWH